jgi:hypothetical protein
MSVQNPAELEQGSSTPPSKISIGLQMILPGLNDGIKPGPGSQPASQLAEPANGQLW